MADPALPAARGRIALPVPGAGAAAAVVVPPEVRPGARAAPGQILDPGPRLRPDPRLWASPSPDEPRILGLIDQIYDAAVGSEDWALVLKHLAEMLGGEAVVLRRIGAATSLPPTLATETDPAYVQDYQAHYHKLLPILPLLSQLPAGPAFANSMLIPEAEYRRTEFYNDFMRPQSKDHGLYWVDFDQSELSAMLSLWRPRSRPDWDETQLRVLRVLGPHLGRALRIERSLIGTGTPGAATPPQLPTILTPREQDCLGWVARGASSKEAARQLSLSVYTVNEYVASAMRKLGASSRTEAVAMALASGAIGG
jgi:DNA-binding CsgD family transcriptional regulator